MSPIDILLPRLDKVRGSCPQWTAICPAHEDGSPSLSVKSLEDGRVLIHCFAGCHASDVMAAAGLSLSDLFPRGALGELMSKPYRKPENVLYTGGYVSMQSEIDKLKARLSAK